MSSLPQNYTHFQYATNFYQRKMVQPDNVAAQNQSTFDEEKFLQSGKFIGLLRAIFTTIITFDSNPFCEFIADFESSVNANNFKAVLKEHVTDQQERDQIDALSAPQLAQIRDFIVLLEDNREKISRKLETYSWLENVNDHLYFESIDRSDYYEMGMFTVRVEKGRAGIQIDETSHELVSFEQFVSGQGTGTLKIHNKGELTGINLKGRVQQDAGIYRTVLNRFDFSKADLSKMKSEYTTFKEGTFDKTVLNGATLSNVTFQDVSLQGASARSVDIVRGYFSDKHIYSDKLKVEDAQFQRVNLSDIQIEGAYFKKVTLTDVKAANANFECVRFDNTRFETGDMNKANFFDINAAGLVMNKIDLSGSTFEKGRFVNTLFNNVNLAMVRCKVRKELFPNAYHYPYGPDDNEFEEEEVPVEFCDSIFKNVKITGANFKGARFSNVRISVRLDDMAELPGTLSAIKTIRYTGEPENNSLKSDVVMQATALIASIELAKQLSETLAHLRVIDDAAIKSELMKYVLRQFKVIDANRSKVESPELIVQTEELRQQLLAEVNGQSFYESVSEVEAFIKDAVLKQTIFGYSQRYVVDGATV